MNGRVAVPIAGLLLGFAVQAAAAAPAPAVPLTTPNAAAAAGPVDSSQAPAGSAAWHLTLEEAIREAVDRHPAVAGAREKLQGAQESLEAQRAAFRPQGAIAADALRLSSSLPRSSQPGEEPQWTDPSWQQGGTFTLSWAMPGSPSASVQLDLTRREGQAELDPSASAQVNFTLWPPPALSSQQSALDRASRSVAQSEAQLSWQRVSSAVDTFLAYRQLQVAREREQVAAQAVSDALTALETVRRTLAAGHATESDLLQAQQAALEAQRSYEQAANQATESEASLVEAVTGQRPGAGPATSLVLEPLPYPDLPSAKKAVEELRQEALWPLEPYAAGGARGGLDPAQAATVRRLTRALPQGLEEAALLADPSLLSTAAAVDAARTELAAAEATRWPQLTLSGRVQRNAEGSGTPSQPEASWSAGLQLSYGLFDGGARAAEIRSKRRQLEQALADHEAQQQAVVRALAQQWNSLALAAIDVELALLRAQTADLEAQRRRAQASSGLLSQPFVATTERSARLAMLELIDAIEAFRAERFRLQQMTGQTPALPGLRTALLGGGL